MDITEQIAELRAKLEELERQTQEEPKPLLTGPCIAKTRAGDLVPVYRGNRDGYCFQYLVESVCQTVSEDGKYRSDKHDHDSDIVEVIRPLTEQEVLDWQFRGIEPDLNEARDVVAEGFEHSDEGRKRAKELGLVYLGKATERQDMSLPGELYVYELEIWRKKAAIDRTVCKGSIYAYKPSGE